MIKKILLTLLFFSFFGGLSAQTVSEIKNNPKYIYGEGRAATIVQAQNFALNAIINQISVSVRSDFMLKDMETGNDDDMVLESMFESTIKTYAKETLVNTKQIVVEDEPNAHVFRYILVSDLEKIFEGRKKKAEDMLEEAQKALDDRRVNDALKYYFWSHVLIKSLRYPNDVRVYDEKGESQMANFWIPIRMKEIFKNLSFKVSDIDDSTLYLDIRYKGEPVNSVDFSCFDGYAMSNLYSASDGEGIIDLRSSVEVNNIRLQVEYMFVNESLVDKEVNDLIEFSRNVIYRDASYNLSLKGKGAVSATKQQTKKSVSSSDLQYPSMNKVDNVIAYNTIIDRVLDAVELKDIESVKSYFTVDGFKCFNQLIGFGSAKIVNRTDLKYYSFDDEVYCRNTLMNFSFKGNSREFMENVVFKFDVNRKICNVNFGLSKLATEDLLSKDMWSVDARMVLIHFLEGYKSAYALKQLDYIESIFANDALIITGHVVRQATSAEMTNMNLKKVNYTRQTKAQYIKNLSYVFKGNEFVNLKFGESDITKSGKSGEVYGIQIKQDYFSSRYGDTGYLFLMVDLKDIDKPLIHVRTWQPERDPKFGIYGLQNF